MCTVVILRRPGHRWPLILGANRDEMAARPWKPPARHWPDRPDVTAGLDVEAQGSWLGMNDFGLVAAVLNRPGSLGPKSGKRSRGELVLEALDHAEASEAAKALAALSPAAYRPFNLVVADRQNAFWLALKEDEGEIEVSAIPEGLSMLTAHDLNDPTSERILIHRPRFEAAAPPAPDSDDWTSWQGLLGDVETGGNGPQDTLCFQLENGFGTRSSSILAVAGPGGVAEAKAHWQFNPTPADAGGWRALF